MSRTCNGEVPVSPPQQSILQLLLICFKMEDASASDDTPSLSIIPYDNNREIVL